VSAAFFALGAALVLAVVGFSFLNTSAPALAEAEHLPRLVPPAPKASASSSSLPIKSVSVRADAALDRSGYTLVGAGALFVPASFHSEDGVFDLLVFFHGNAELVAQSVSAAKLNALVLVVNIGIGSGAYESHYATAAIFQHELVRVVEVATARGLVNARIGRLALGAWSAGYGALLRILARDEVHTRASAVLLADALHSNFADPHSRTVDMERIRPFVRFARGAAAEEKLFVMTHSEVNEFRYATTTETADALVTAVGAYRTRTADWPERPSFPLARSVMSAERWLEQRSEAHKGHFHVRGYRGYREDDHIAHLAQMSSTVLADLVAYWSKRTSKGPLNPDLQSLPARR
jgi:hypothetical protein